MVAHIRQAEMKSKAVIIGYLESRNYSIMSSSILKLSLQCMVKESLEEMWMC